MIPADEVSKKLVAYAKAQMEQATGSAKVSLDAFWKETAPATSETSQDAVEEAAMRQLLKEGWNSYHTEERDWQIGGRTYQVYRFLIVYPYEAPTPAQEKRRLLFWLLALVVVLAFVWFLMGAPWVSHGNFCSLTIPYNESAGTYGSC